MRTDRHEEGNSRFIAILRMRLKTCHDGRSKDQDLNHGPRKYEVGVLPSRRQDLMIRC
jgi:hypothetical protein